MNSWTNIEIGPNDPEISQIDGFEICHFKYKQHISCIKDSIINLKPTIIAEDIGKNHVRHGDHVWEKDESGSPIEV